MRHDLDVSGRPMIPAIVTWYDAHADATTWTDIAELDPIPRVITSVGWLIPDAVHDHITLAQSFDGDTVDSVLHIPCAVVGDIRQLEET